MTDSLDTADPDDRWRELLRTADPLIESLADHEQGEPTRSNAPTAPEVLATTEPWQAALARLQATVSDNLKIDPLNGKKELIPVDCPDLDVAAVGLPERQAVPASIRWRLSAAGTVGLLVSLAAALLLALGAWGWLERRSRQAEETLAERQTESVDPSGSIQSPPEPSTGPSTTPIGTPGERTLPDSLRADSNTLASANNRSAKIQSVQQLTKLRPSQLASVQRQLDSTALDRELQAWLRQWDAAQPAGRARLEGQWVECRGFWVGWTLQGLRDWKEPSVLRAGIEVLSLEFGPRAAEILAFCWQRPATRPLARPVLVPLADETQLAQWLWGAQDAEELQALVTELAQRPGPVATQALATLAAEPACQPVLLQAERRWSPLHLQRAVADLSSPQPATQFRAAMLLRALPLADVEGELQRKIALGQQLLPALAVLLLRYNEQVPPQAQSLFQTNTVAAALPSARQRAQKWLRQQHVEFSDSTSLRKVCQQCVTEI